ncbi:MAG: MarR family transcriptional regulator [Bacteroidetes bacterium]|nr:MAG: MarR family transcriptional regulator [Bacteroidota bacterium]
MKLEEAIQQKVPFRSPWQRAAVNLLYTNNWLIGHQKELFKPFGITLQQYNVLRILRGQHPDPISTSEIRDRMLDKMSDVSRIVDRLVRKQLVVRRPCKADKRLVDVFISEQGLALLRELDHLDTDFDSVLKGLTKEEADLLNELLDKARGD